MQMVVEVNDFIFEKIAVANCRNTN